MLRVLKSLIKASLRRRSLVLARECEFDVLAAQHHLRRVFGCHAIDCVLDVGANRGQFRDMLRTSVRYSGAIHSFEPVSTYARALEARAEDDPAWTIHACALGRTAGQAQINLTSSPGLPSLLQPDLPAMHKLLPGPRVTITGTETITVRRLDEAARGIRNLNEDSRVFLKLDTQGFDMEVLVGAGSFLGRIVALQTELSIQPIYRDMPDYRSVLAFLEQQGFVISSLVPVTLDSQLRAVELDCVMVRSNRSRRDT